RNRARPRPDRLDAGRRLRGARRARAASTRRARVSLPRWSSASRRSALAGAASSRLELRDARGEYVERLVGERDRIAVGMAKYQVSARRTSAIRRALRLSPRTWIRGTSF